MGVDDFIPELKLSVEFVIRIRVPACDGTFEAMLDIG